MDDDYRIVRAKVDISSQKEDDKNMNWYQTKLSKKEHQKIIHTLHGSARDTKIEGKMTNK